MYVDPNLRRTLYLGLPDRAVLTELADPNDRSDVLTSQHLKEKRGSFTLDEARRVVRVRIGGSDAEYRVMEPVGLSECALIKGDLAHADYLSSWFGQMDDSDIHDANEP